MLLPAGSRWPGKLTLDVKVEMSCGRGLTMCRPRPREPPVTRAILPSRRKRLSYPLISDIVDVDVKITTRMN
jgi:hypothetical protein